MFQQAANTGWDVDHRVPILRARFQENHPDVRIFAQTARDDAAGRTGAYDDIVSIISHFLPLTLLRIRAVFSRSMSLVRS